MEDKLLLLLTLAAALLFTTLGVFAWRREKPMWFWADGTPDPATLTDIPAYNRANGKMWLIYSLIFWLSTPVCLVNETVGGLLMAILALAALPFLAAAYKKIYRKYQI